MKKIRAKEKIKRNSLLLDSLDIAPYKLGSTVDTRHSPHSFPTKPTRSNKHYDSTPDITQERNIFDD